MPESSWTRTPPDRIGWWWYRDPADGTQTIAKPIHIWAWRDGCLAAAFDGISEPDAMPGLWGGRIEPAPSWEPST